MTTGILRSRPRSACGLLCLALLVGRGQSEEERWAEVGRAIAPELDELNAVPIGVLDEFRCHYRIEPCRERKGHINASLVDASALVSSFAEARGIPVSRYEDVVAPFCHWFAEEGEAAGLYAEFVAPPQVEGDSARVELATGCRTPESAFEQSHEFILRRENGSWIVAERRLTSVT
jgi:hypothetical protein